MPQQDATRITPDRPATEPPGPIAAPRGPLVSRRPDPLRPYLRRCLVVDLLMVTASLVTASLVAGAVDLDTTSAVTQAAVISLAAVSWLAVLVLRGAYDARYVGVGNDEFKRVVSAGVVLLAGMVLLAFLVEIRLSRTAVVVGSLLGIVLLLCGRWLLRSWLGRQRIDGRYLRRTLVLGSPGPASSLAGLLDRDPVAGFSVVAVVDAVDADVDDTWLADVLARVHRGDVDAVAVADAGFLGSDRIRRLAWGLEEPGVDLLVDPSLGDVAGPRVAMRPAAGLPLIHVDEPHLTGPRRWVKRALDLLIGLPLLLAMLPVMVVVALAVRLAGGGPALFRQTRIGHAGQPFTLVKFRTMVVDAEATGPSSISSGDPRVTRVGRVLRRWSLDETPQLFAVVRGTMSLVGPRPMLPAELGLLADATRRRHLTKPGLTGLSQVAGRKEVDWDDRLRLDLHYVENWSVALDLVIIARTVKAVLLGRGAF